MANDWEVVKLRDGTELKVRPLPSQFLIEKVAGRYPLPRPPRQEIKSGIPGVPPTWVERHDDPDYLAERDVAIRKRVEATQQTQWLYCIDVPTPPKGWKKEFDGFLAADEWRTGPDAERLDYLEYVLLRSVADLQAVMKVINSNLEPIEEAEVKAAEDTFPGPAEGA